LSTMKTLLGVTRPPFLILGPACVALGVGTAYWQTHTLNAWHVILVLIGAVMTHISVNAFNEYFDFKSSLDKRTEPTPFSGGSGILPKHPDLLQLALVTAVVSLVISGLIGVYFILVRGINLLPLGLLGLLVVIIYTPLLTYNPFLCLVAPGLGFGTFMVMGTHFALTGTYTWTSFLASLIPFFLVSDLLLLNQFPDVSADQSIGRNHYPILIGRKLSSLIYGAFLLFTYLTIIIAVIFRLFPVPCLLGLVTLYFAVPTAINAYRNAEDVPQLIPHMAKNVLINILTPVLVAIGFFIG
jgi:1,4-dihydroxy-2-naphthoate octaprenyltransferase